MATGGYRTLKRTLGRGLSGLQPTKGKSEGLRALLEEVISDLQDLSTHTHTYDGTTTATAAITSEPGSDAEGQAATTAISFGAYTIES